MVAPINSNKHYVHRTNLAVASAAVSKHTVVNAVVAPATGTAADVEEGSIVKTIHYEYWLSNIGNTDTNTQFTILIEKIPSGQVSVTAAQMANLGAYPNKKNILWTSQGVLAAAVDGQSSVPIIRNWLLIPKGKQRMGLGDEVSVSMLPTGTAINWCGLSTYKEYR